MSTKLTYTGAEVQELLDKIEKGDFDNAKTLEGHPASYFAIASEFTPLAEAFATEQGRINTLYSYFNNGSANDALRLGGQLPSYYATATQYEILQRTLSDFKSLFDSMFEKDSDGNIHAKLSLWSSGGITAGGVGSGGSGGGGISYNRLDSWADYSADKSGWVLSALLGNDLNTRLISVENAGYITQSALAPYALRSEIPSLEGYFLASNFNQANIKSTLGISDWALAEYPTYLIAQGNVMAGEWAEPHGLSVGGWLSNDSGFGYAYGTSLNVTYNMWHHRLAFRTDGLIDHWMGINTNKMSKVGQLAHISDIPTKLSQLTDDVMAGNYLSKNGGTVNGSITAPSFIGNLTGNADSATKLQTARTIWGRFFDGTDDVNGTLYGVNFIRNYNANEIIYEDTIDGDVYVGCSSFAKARVLINANGRLVLTESGNVAIGGTTADEKLHVHGNGKFTGALISQALSSAGISIGCDASGVASDNYAREINTFANKLYLQYRGGDLDLCGGGGTTYIGGALDGKTANFTSLTAPAITTNSLTIGGATITYDSVNEALCVNGNMYALGGITAGGAGISAYTSLESRVARLEQQLNIS